MYKDVHADCKGGVTLFLVQLKIMVFMSHNTINALRKYLMGLHRICGKNVTVAEKVIAAVCL